LKGCKIAGAKTLADLLEYRAVFDNGNENLNFDVVLLVGSKDTTTANAVLPASDGREYSTDPLPW
jgi:hypothetical protein